MKASGNANRLVADGHAESVSALVSEALAVEDPANQETVYDRAQIHAAIGDVLRDLGRPDDAAAEYVRSLELGEAGLAAEDPAYAWTWARSSD